MASSPSSSTSTTSSVWCSPLKPGSNPAVSSRSQLSSSAKKNLFGDDPASPSTNTDVLSELREKKENGSAKEEINYTTLAHIYQFDFEKPSTEANALQFFAIREQVLAIETFLSQSKEPLNLPYIRHIVSHWLKCPSYEKKMSELGLLLFYLDKGGHLPETESLLEYRATEIKKNAEEYMEAHSKAQANLQIASGKTHYLMRVFAHMLFIRDPLTPAQTYNRGGLIAVKQLLLQPSLEISKFLQPEHREHILIVADQILNHTGMVNFFKQKLRVHPDLQDAVRFNLKLKPAEAIHSIHVFYDCMMALFSDIRQLESPNCYAISALIYAIENHTYKVLVHLVRWLSEGHFIFKTTTAFPIQPLIEKRLVYSDDLNLAQDSGKALTLATLGNLSDVLELETKNRTTGIKPVGSILSELLQANNAANLQNNLEKYYSTYKHHTLVHLMLAILETGYINSEHDDYSKPKKGLIEACLKEFEALPKHLKPSSPIFLSRLKTKLEKRLWLENCRENKVVMGPDKHTLTVGSQTITHFKGDVRDLAEVFKRAQRIFCLISGKYLPILSYSDLEKVIIAAIAEVKTELEDEGKAQEASVAERYTKIAVDWEFRIAMSNFASRQIDRKKILGRDLNKCNLLIFKETGGQIDTALEAAFGIKVVSHNLVGCSTPYRFLETLMVKLKEFDQDLFNGSRRAVISTNEHAWTLSPSCWKLLMENQNKFHSFIQKNVFNVAKNRLSNVVSEDLVERVIQSYAKNEEIRKEMRSVFCERKNFTFNQFKKELLEGVQSPRDVGLMRQVIEDEFSKVQLKKNDFEEVLKQLSLRPQEDTLLESLHKKMNSEPMQPYQLALRLRTLLIEEKIAILEPYEIEQVICKVLRFPLTLQVGDLNWVDTFREDSEHLHLMINFSWELGIPAYFVRSPYQQKMQNGREYEWVKIQHPQTLTIKPQW